MKITLRNPRKSSAYIFRIIYHYYKSPKFSKYFTRHPTGHHPMKRTTRPQHVDTPEKCTCHKFFGCTHHTTLETQTYQARKHTIQLEIQEVHTTSSCMYCPAQKDVTAYDFVMDGIHYQYTTLDEARARLKDFMSW